MSTTNFDLFFTHSESSQNLGAKRGRKPKAEKEKETPKRPKSRSETVLWCTVRAKSTGNDELWQKGQIIYINNLQSRGMCNSRGQKVVDIISFAMNSSELLFPVSIYSHFMYSSTHIYFLLLYILCAQARDDDKQSNRDVDNRRIRRRKQRGEGGGVHLGGGGGEGVS